MGNLSQADAAIEEVINRPENVKLTLVVPVFNEEATVSIFYETFSTLFATRAEKLEFIFVNDGSTDNTLHFLLKLRNFDDRVKVVDLSRNFGKEAALTAGLDLSSGDAVIPIDVDLQDPPSVVPLLLDKWYAGFDMVLAKRLDRASDTFLKRTSAYCFYKFIGKLSKVSIPEHVGDFRLLDQKVVQTLRLLPERARFMKGILSWPGFRQATIEYTRNTRSAGTTKWKPLALWGLALEGIISFSDVPLKIWSYVGFACAAVGFCYGTYIVVRTLVFGADLPGYASMISFMLFLNGIVLVGLGVIGEYLARIFMEVKARPIYVIRSSWGLAVLKASETR